GYDSSEKHIIELFKHKRLAGTFVPNLDELVFLDKILKLFKSTGFNLSQVKDRGLDLISLMTIRFADSQMIGSTLKYSYDELLNVFIKNGLVINMEALYNSMSKNGLGDSGSICNGVRTPQTLIYLIENNYLQPNNSEGRDSYYPLSKCITDIPFTELKESNIESFKQLIQTMKDYEFEIININDPYSNILTELFYNKNLYQFVRNYASTPFVMGESHFKDLIETSMMSEEEKLQILADEIYIYNNEHLKILAEIDRADLFELVFNKIFSAATPANYQNDLAYYFFENNYIDSLSKVLDLERKFIQNGHKFNSSMHYAVTKNNLDFIKYLLNAGFIIDLLNQSELTPLENLFLNTSRPDFKLVRFLLDQGARTSFIDENGNNLIQLSILNENSSSYVSVTTETLVDKLIGESLDINYKNNKGESIFIMFSQKPTIDRQFLLKLLSLNANVNLSDNKGNTIIHYLASKDTKYTSYNKLIQTIVSTYKVDLKKVNNDGFTALEIAIKNENFELAKILLDARGD
ncbi:MAG: ankyrin repeat domain-containing protein, partial [Ignavibacteriae bacterium]|nr:ankyrin repeat domain-containing protein [Ignavibacteriota bacterium]